MRTFAIAASCLLVFTVSSFAQTPVVASFTGGTTFGSVDGTDQTIGYTFVPTANLSVSALGVWESNTSVPLTQTHQVGLWTDSGTLLASGTVLTTSPATGSWRYVSITPVVLTAGQTYRVGSAITSPYTDSYTRVALPGGTVTTNGLITIGVSLTNASEGGFSFPSTIGASFLARFGPNLIATPTGTATVPIAPWVGGVIAVGLMALALIELRRRRPAADLRG